MEEKSKYTDYNKTAAVVVHPVEHAQAYVELVGDINPVHRQDDLAVKAYNLLTQDILPKRKGDFLRGREIISRDRPNRRIIQGLYTANVSTIDLLPPELKQNIVGHTCIFSNPWLNSGDGETAITGVSYRQTFATTVGDRTIPVHAFEIIKTIRGTPEWYIRKCFSFLSNESLERKIKEEEGMDLLFNGYIFASEEPLDFTAIKTIDKPYDRRTKINSDCEYLVNIITKLEEVAKFPYTKAARKQLEEGRNPSLVLTDLLKEMIGDQETLNSEVPTIAIKTFNFDQTAFENYKKFLRVDPNAPLCFDYFESRIPGVALEIAAKRGLFENSFVVYRSQDFKAKSTLTLNESAIPRTFSIIAISLEEKNNQYPIEEAILLGDQLLGLGSTNGVLIGGEETKEVRKSFSEVLRGFLKRT